VRALVAIANHGSAKRHLVDQLVASYRSFPADVDVVVLGDRAKPVPTGTELLVGAPSDNPFSLPFAHRRLFAQRRHDYDLFIYTEDDTLLEPRHLETWLDVQAQLPAEAVCGFVRYEIRPDGARSYTTFNSAFHWDTTSITTFGTELVADYTNHHGAVYVLARHHLERALASGRYDVAPHRGRYDMLVSAGAAFFRECGLRRVLPLRRIRDVAVHHLTDRYVGVMGIDDATLDRQVRACIDVHSGVRRRGQLFPVRTRVDHFAYDRLLHEPALDHVEQGVPRWARRVLVVGAGLGDLEPSLAARSELTAVPLDAVVQAELAHRGIRTTEPDLAAALAALRHERFDAVVLPDVLAHVREPRAWLHSLRELVAPGGCVVASTFDHRRMRVRAAVQHVAEHRLLKGPANSRLRPLPAGGYAGNGVHATTREWVVRQLRSAGFVGCRSAREHPQPPQVTPRPSVLDRVLPSHVVAWASAP
jgi:2-polyprenyl-3-methyl-5-hydroxy-6-metoxy-1,4-benzoquinol methylase